MSETDYIDFNRRGMQLIALAIHYELSPMERSYALEIAHRSRGPRLDCHRLL